MLEQASTEQNVGLRILLIEDNLNDVELLRLVLTAEVPCDLRLASTETAFEAELAGRPDIIVSDSNVKAFNGMAALKIAKERRPDIPFVMCSGNSSENSQQRAIENGADACASKDNSFIQLVHVVKRLCAAKLPNLQ